MIVLDPVIGTGRKETSVCKAGPDLDSLREGLKDILIHNCASERQSRVFAAIRDF